MPNHLGETEPLNASYFCITIFGFANHIHLEGLHSQAIYPINNESLLQRLLAPFTYENQMTWIPYRPEKHKRKNMATKFEPTSEGLQRDDPAIHLGADLEASTKLLMPSLPCITQQLVTKSADAGQVGAKQLLDGEGKVLLNINSC